MPGRRNSHPRATAADEKKPRQSDVRVITEAVYRANGVAGSGYVDSDRPSQIWTVAIDGRGIRAEADHVGPVRFGQLPLVD